MRRMSPIPMIVTCGGMPPFAFASRLTDSFAKYRWCTNIIGPMGGGTVDDLPLHQFESMGAIQTKIPTEVLISETPRIRAGRRGVYFTDHCAKGSDNACFFSANSVQKPKFFGNSEEGKAAELNYKLGTQLPYMYVANPVGPLPESDSTREYRKLEGAIRSRPRIEPMDKAVCCRPG